jgi:hypothetical protein
MKLFYCVAFDVEYAVQAETAQAALDKLKATPTVVAILEEYAKDGEEVQDNDFYAREYRELSPGVFFNQGR